MATTLEQSAVEFVRMWCQLFVGKTPDVARAMAWFQGDATVLIPSVPYRLTPAADREEIEFSHLVDGRGEVHYWQVLEPRATVIDNTAVVSYYARYNVGRHGESTIKCAKESLVLVQDHGGWRIVHLHNSAAHA